MRIEPGTRFFITSAVLLGIGLGGLIDGISLHQLAQTHNMLFFVVSGILLSGFGLWIIRSELYRSSVDGRPTAS